MNCPQCNTESETRWLLTSTYDHCPKCKVNYLASKAQPKSGIACLTDSNSIEWSANNMHGFKDGDLVNEIHLNELGTVVFKPIYWVDDGGDCGTRFYKQCIPVLMKSGECYWSYAHWWRKV